MALASAAAKIFGFVAGSLLVRSRYQDTSL